MELPVKYREFLENALEYVKDDELWETFAEKVSVDAYGANNVDWCGRSEDGSSLATNDDKLHAEHRVTATGRQSVSRTAAAVVASVLLERVGIEKGVLRGERSDTNDETGALEFRTELRGAERIVTRFAPTGLLASGDAMGAYSLAVDALLEMASEKATFCDVMLSYNNGHVVVGKGGTAAGSRGNIKGESCVHAAMHSLGTLADIFSRMLFWEVSADPDLIPTLPLRAQHHDRSMMPTNAHSREDCSKSNSNHRDEELDTSDRDISTYGIGIGIDIECGGGESADGNVNDCSMGNKQSRSIPADSASLETWWHSFVSYHAHDICDSAANADNVCQRQPESPTTRGTHLLQFIASSAIREAAIGMVPECYKMLDEVQHNNNSNGSLHSNSEQFEGNDEERSVGAAVSGGSDSSPRLRVLRRLFQAVAMCRIIRSMVWSMFANEVRRQQQQQQQVSTHIGGSPNTALSAPSPPSTLFLLQKVKTALRKSIVPDTQLCLTRIILPLLAVATSQTPQSDPHSQGCAVGSANKGEGEDDDDYDDNNRLGDLDRIVCEDPLQDLLIGNDIQPSMVSLGGGGGGETSRVTQASSLSQRAAEASINGGEPMAVCPPALALVFDSFVLPLLEDLCWIAQHENGVEGDNKHTSEREKERRENPHHHDAAIKDANIPIANTVLEVMGLFLHSLRYGTWNENTNTVSSLLQLGALFDSAYNNNNNNNNNNNTNSSTVAGATPVTAMVTRQTSPLKTKTKIMKKMVMSPLLACLVKEREAKYQTAMSIYKKRMASMEAGTNVPPRRIMFAEPKREALGSYDGDSLDYLVMSGGCVESEQYFMKGRQQEEDEKEDFLLPNNKRGSSSSYGPLASSPSSLPYPHWVEYCLGRCESLLCALLVPHNHSPVLERDGTKETIETNPPTTTTSTFSLRAAVIRKVLGLRSTNLRDSSTTSTDMDVNGKVKPVNVREWWDANATDPTQKFSDLIDPVHAREMSVEQKMVRMESRTKALAPFVIFDDDDEDDDVANEREHGGLVKISTNTGGLRGGGSIGFYNDDEDGSMGYVWLSSEERAVRRGERTLLARLTGKTVLSAKASSSSSSNPHRLKTARDFINLINNVTTPPKLRSPAVTTAYLLLRLLQQQQQSSFAHAAGDGEPLTSTRSTSSMPTLSSVQSSLEFLHSFAPIAVAALKMTPPQQKHSNGNDGGGEDTDGNGDDAEKDATREFIATLSTSAVVLVVLEKLLIAYLYGKSAEDSVGDVNANKRGNNKYTIDFPEEFLHAQEERTDALLIQGHAGGRDSDETNNATTTTSSSALKDAGTHEVRSSPIYHAYAKLAQCLVTMILTCPSGEHRCFARRVLGLLLDCFAIGVRRKLLSALFSLAPTGRAAESILAIIKAEVMSDSSGHSSSPNVRAVGQQASLLPQKTEAINENNKNSDNRCSSTPPITAHAYGVAQVTIAYASQPERFLNHRMALEMVLAAKIWFNRNIKLMRQHEWVGAITAVTQLVRLVLTQELRRIEGATSAYAAAKGGDLARTSLSDQKPEEEQQRDVSEALGAIVTSLSVLSPEHCGFSLVTPFDLSKIRRYYIEACNKQKSNNKTTDGHPTALISPVAAIVNPHRICLSPSSSSSASFTTLSQSGAPANGVNNNNNINSDLGGLQHEGDAASILLPKQQRRSAEYVVGVLIHEVLNPLKEYLSKELLGGGRGGEGNANGKVTTAATIAQTPLSVTVSSSIMTSTGSSNNIGAGFITPAVLFGLELAVEGIEGLVQRVGR